MFIRGISITGLFAKFGAKIGAAAQSRFATDASRFRLAVSAGFLIVAVSFLVVGPGGRFGVADSIWGAMGLPDLSGGFSQGYQAPAPSPQYYSSEAAGAGHHRHRPKLARRRASELVQNAGYEAPNHGYALARRSMCVRLCDGFAFPVGDYHGDGERGAHEATCQSECPGAKTALFILPQGSDTISDATEVGTGRNYSELSDAFHYTTYLDESCSCHPASGNRVKSLLHDFTLRRGDTVMTSHGMQVFHGGSSFPFKRRDFVALARSKDVRKGDRENLRAIERASLTRPFPGSVQPTTVARRNGTKSLEHQAKN